MTRFAVLPVECVDDVASEVAGLTKQPYILAVRVVFLEHVPYEVEVLTTKGFEVRSARWFTRSGAAVEPDFFNPAVRNYGQVLALGDYEVSAENIMEVADGV